MVPAAVRSRLRLVDCARDIAYIEAPAALIATARARGDTLERKRQLLPPPSRHKRKQRGGKTLKPNEVSGAYLAAVATALANPLQRLGDQLEPLCLPAAGNHQPTAVGELHSFDAALVEAYFVPLHDAESAIKNAHKEWLESGAKSKGSNMTFAIWFDKGVANSGHFSEKWSRFQLPHKVSAAN